MTDQRLLQAVFYNNPDQYPPIINGIRLLSKSGFRVELFCRDDGNVWNVSYPDTARIHRIPASRQNSKSEFLDFAREVLSRSRKDSAAFIGHDMHGFLVAKVLSAYRKRPLIYHNHDFAEDLGSLRLGSKLVGLFERTMARTSNLTIIPDAERAALVAQKLRLKEAPIVAANAPLGQPVGNGGSLTGVLASKGLHFDAIAIRQGRIGPGHAIEPTIRSIPYWKGKNWGLVLVGPGHRDYVEYLRSLSREVASDGRVVILPPVPYDELPGYTMDAAVGIALYESIHVNHATSTTSSNKMMEYMAASLPVIVSDTPSLRSFMSAHECGFTADERCPQSIAAAVNRLLGDPAFAQAIGRAGARAFCKNFNYEIQYRPVLDWLAAASAKTQSPSGALKDGAGAFV